MVRCLEVRDGDVVDILQHLQARQGAAVEVGEIGQLVARPVEGGQINGDELLFCQDQQSCGGGGCGGENGNLDKVVRMGEVRMRF